MFLYCSQTWINVCVRAAWAGGRQIQHQHCGSSRDGGGRKWFAWMSCRKGPVKSSSSRGMEMKEKWIQTKGLCAVWLIGGWVELFRLVAVRNRRRVWPATCTAGGMTSPVHRWTEKKNGAVLFRRRAAQPHWTMLSVHPLPFTLYAPPDSRPGPLRGFQGAPGKRKHTFDCDLVHWRTYSPD